MGDPLPLMPLLYVLLGYLVLQIVLNLGLGLWLRMRKAPVVTVLKSTFWSGVINAVYFVAVAAVLHQRGLAPNAPSIPLDLWLWAVVGVILGPLLWYLTTRARYLGLLLFGRGELVAAEDAVLRVPPSPTYLTLGIVNVALIQPLGREVFMRGAFFPTVALTFGWWWALVATLIIELLLRLNIVWLFQTVVYTLVMCTLFYLSGNALCGLVAASTAGLIHGVALAHITLKEKMRGVIDEEKQADESSPIRVD